MDLTFKNLRKKLYFYFLRRKLNELQASRSIINLHQARYIGILINANDPDKFELAKAYINRLSATGNRKVEVLAYKRKLLENEVFPYPVITEKDVNLLMYSRKEASVRFAEKEFDLLLNLYDEECLPLEYISATSESKFRVGAYNASNTDAYDFMIDNTKSGNIQSLIEQIDFYLNYINKTAV